MSIILIVEDNEKNLKLVRDVLQHRGHATVEAKTGRDGLRLAREAKPDLILLDIQLPDIDGISALRELRADAAFAHTAMIAISASAMPGGGASISRSTNPNIAALTPIASAKVRMTPATNDGSRLSERRV